MDRVRTRGANTELILSNANVDLCVLMCGTVCLRMLQGKCDAITAVKLLSCFDDLVAVGTASGRVAVFQLVSPLPGRNKQVRTSSGLFQTTGAAGL